MKQKPIICPRCSEIIGYNETGELDGQEAMFCKNRPHNRKWNVRDLEKKNDKK